MRIIQNDPQLFLIINPNPRLINIRDRVPIKNQFEFSYLYITDSPNKHNPLENNINPTRAKT